MMQDVPEDERYDISYGEAQLGASHIQRTEIKKKKKKKMFSLSVIATTARRSPWRHRYEIDKILKSKVKCRREMCTDIPDRSWNPIWSN